MKYRIAPHGQSYRAEIIGKNSQVPLTDADGEPIDFPSEEAARAELAIRCARFCSGVKNEKKDSLEEFHETYLQA